MSVAVVDEFSGVARMLDRLVEAKVLPGASALVMRDGRETLFHAAGFADVEGGDAISRETIFRIYSMTKPVTAAAVMILVDDGVISLGDPVSKYIPELADLGVHVARGDQGIETTPARQGTVKDLLTHTAGYSYWFQPGSPVADLYDSELKAGRHELWRFVPSLGGLSGLALALQRVPLVSQPGDKWHYSLSLEVAGLVVERASGQSLDDFMSRRIFAPLGMVDTGFSVHPDKAHRLASLYETQPDGALTCVERGKNSVLLGEVPGLSGGGGLMSTIGDYARFAEMLRQEGEFGGRRILSTASARAMMSSQLEPHQLAELPELAAFGLGGSGEGLGFGLGGAVVTRPSASAAPTVEGEYSWGGAASTTFWVDRKNNLSVIFMTQVVPPSAEMLWDQLHAAIYLP